MNTLHRTLRGHKNHGGFLHRRAMAPRPLPRALLAETLGTWFMVMIGCGSVCSSLSGVYSGVWQVSAMRTKSTRAL